ncbi:MAG: Crp/Fnr family transcriptional regulator [Pseudomonadota bacterium]
MSQPTGASLDTIPLFEVLDEQQRERLAQACRWRRYDAHEQIIDRDADTSEVHFVVDGLVRIVIYSLSGREIAFDDLPTGQFFGELAGIDRGRRSASVVALKPTLVAAMNAQLFMETVCNDPACAERLLTHLTGMVRRATDRIMDLSTLGANNRVHAEILRLARPNLEADNTAKIRPIPIHSDIAARVSTARETVARVFGQLAQSGIVERRSDHLFVRRFDELEEIVEEVRGDFA